MKQKNIIFLIAIFSFILLNTIIAFNIYKTKFISKDIVRLHVIANSNSIEDQIIKLKIEEKIKNYIYSLNYLDKNDLINSIKENEEKILNIANCTISQNKKNYSSILKIGKISYDKKENMNLNMDAGIYDSASIVLGKGDGKNIWSIIFPNEKTIDKIKELDTIIPGISGIYENDTNTNVSKIKSKILDTLNISI